jgi:phosphosulfolactate synthase
MTSNFLVTPDRNSKPRAYGITSLIDDGAPLNYFRDVIESDAHLIDIVKFGWCTSLVSRNIDKKIECLIEHNVEYYFGGTLFEKALSQNQLEAFYNFLKHYNCKMMEVSDGTLTLSRADKSSHISSFSKEFIVLSEVGKKDIDEADHMPISQWIDEIQHDLAAGASKVILESRESGVSGICDAQGNLRADLVSSISNSRFRMADAIWEAPNKMLQTSLITSIGPNVNLANIPFGDVLALETLRLGLFADSFNLNDNINSNHDISVQDRRSASVA